MKHVSDWQLMVLSVSIFIGIGSAAARGQAQNVHPSPQELARAFETLDIVLARIADPLLSVSSALLQADAGRNRQRLNDGLRGTAHQWPAIITVSNGKELPAASDLFFVYTEMSDLESYIDSITNLERIREQPRSVVDAATALIKAHTELLPATETLRYAAADRIDAQEARCLPHGPK
jgi:hypothetical protein